MSHDFITEMTNRFDHHDSRMAHEGTPQEVYARLRQDEGLRWTDSHDGFWIASRYEDVQRISRNPDVFASSLGINIPDPTDALSDDDRNMRFMKGKGIAGPPVMYDPPAHGSIRRVLEPLFAPAVVRRREEYIRSVVDRFIDDFVDAGQCDAVAQFCAPVPAIVVLNWLGLPEEDWKVWSEAVLSSFSNPGQYGPDLSAIDLEKIMWTLQQRKEEPTEDIISAVAHMTVNGEPLDDFEKLAMVAQLVLAGLDTTTNAQSGALVELARRPELRRQLTSSEADHRLWSSAIEEFLRFTCPIQGFKRTAREQITLGDVTVKPGERVFILWASANFDDAEFERPGELDITRFPNRHMTFGRGIHRCLGSHLARLELTVMTQRFLKRIPEFTVDETGLELHGDVGVAFGFEKVPLHWA